VHASLDIAGLDEGFLVVFSLRSTASWQDRVTVRDVIYRQADPDLRRLSGVPGGIAIRGSRAGTVAHVNRRPCSRLERILTRDHSATVTRTALPPPQAP
jgi:hypothetical protein